MVNPLLLLAAGIANAVIGMIWYNPRVFGTAWMRMSNITPEQAERGKKRMALSAVIGIIAAAWLAWVMSFVLAAFGVYDIPGAIDVSFWLWAGFVVPVMLGVVLWEAKPLTLYFINIGYWLIALLVTGVILVA